MNLHENIKMLTLGEVSQLLRTSERRLRDKAAAGQIPGAVKLKGMKKWLFQRKGIEKFLGAKLEEL